MRAYGTPHALIFPIYGWSLTHIERSFFAALLKERGRGQLTGCFRPFLTCAKRRACGFSAGPSTLMRKIGFLLSFCGGVFGLVGGIAGLIVTAQGIGYAFPYSLLCIGMRANNPTMELDLLPFLLSVLVYTAVFTGLSIRYLRRRDVAVE